MQAKMSQDKKIIPADELARERNRAAADRTLMAWIRTALSLIGFGFGIGKIAETLEKTRGIAGVDPYHTAQIFGESFIGLGVFSLIAAVVQYRRILKQIEHGEYVYTEPLPLTMITAVILLLIGVFGFFAVLV